MRLQIEQLLLGVTATVGRSFLERFEALDAKRQETIRLTLDAHEKAQAEEQRRTKGGNRSPNKS